jgi:hypothetical protein
MSQLIWNGGIDMITKCRLSVLTYRKIATKKIKEKSGKGVIVYLYHKLLNNTEKKLQAVVYQQPIVLASLRISDCMETK